jgi:glyoxylase-like metal-dependent hydrolase (beta-lactamase superfamily II)
MIFRQLTHDDLGCASYLIGDEDAGVAAVLDPGFGIDEYLELARYMGVSIEHIFETHNHADHVSGHGGLAAATGATIHIHRDAAPEYDHEPFEHGAEWQLGSLRVRALHTPGHRPEHTAFALIDTNRVRSLRDQLLPLPDQVEVWPGHLGGSMCGGPAWT